MGKLRVTDSGLRLEGDVTFLKNLFTSKVLTRKVFENFLGTQLTSLHYILA